jgi:hypothetical protein
VTVSYSARLDARLKELRDKAARASSESIAITPAFNRVVAHAEARSKNPGRRRQIGEILSRRALFYERLKTGTSELSEALGKVEEEFERLRTKVRPLLTNLADPPNREPTLKERLHLEMLMLQMKNFILRRDISLAIVEAPVHAAIIAMNDATHTLVGEKRRFTLDFHELAEEAFGIFVDAVAPPGTTAIAAILKQFRDRTFEAAEKLGNAIEESDRLFDFADLAKAAIDVLDDWRDASQIVISDLHHIAEVEFPAFADELRANREGNTRV